MRPFRAADVVLHHRGRSPSALFSPPPDPLQRTTPISPREFHWESQSLTAKPHITASVISITRVRQPGAACWLGEKKQRVGVTLPFCCLSGFST